MEAILKHAVVLCLGLSLGLYLSPSLVGDKGSQIRSLESDLAERDSQISTLKREIEDLRGRVATSGFESAKLEESMPKRVTKESVPSGAKESLDQNAGDSASAWRANRAIEEMRELIAVDEAEKERLLGRFNDLYRGSTEGKSVEEEKFRIVSEELGSERAEAFRKKETEREQQEFNKKIDDEVIVLSKRLSLSSEQESIVRQALVSAENSISPEREKLRSKMREMMALHVAGEPAKEKLRQGYAEMKAAREELKKTKERTFTEQVGAILSDDQKNKLLELQATSGD